MFVRDWKKVTLIGYSQWAFIALSLLVLAPDAIYFAFQRETNPAVWSILMYLVIFCGYFGRLLLQPEANKWRRRLIIALMVFVSVVFAFKANATEPCEVTDRSEYESIVFGLTSKWEGEHKEGLFHVSYFDTIAKPPLWTVCYGHTKTAGPAQYKTDDECEMLLVDELEEYRLGLHGYFNNTTKWYRLTPHREAAYTSFAYNVGIRGAGKSTATRRLNKGDIKGGCNALTWWNQSGKRVVRGLVNRRADEERLCLIGI